MKISPQERKARLEKIKKIGRSLFAKHEYSKVTIERIIRECKIAKGTFFNYFESKDHLALVLLGETSLDIFSEFQAFVEKSHCKNIAILELVQSILAISFKHFKNMDHIVYASLSFPMEVNQSSFKLQFAFRQTFLWILENIFLAAKQEKLAKRKSEILWYLYLGFLRQWALEKSIKQEKLLLHYDSLFKLLQSSLGGNCHLKYLKLKINGKNLEQFLSPLLPK